MTPSITRLSPADALAEIAASPAGPGIGAFFDLDGTLVEGFTAAIHVGDRIRRRQAGIGELLGVFDAALRYRFGRLEFERLIVRAAGYLRGESLADLDELGERLFVERVASRLYAHMHEIVQAHQRRGHTVVLSSSALSIQALPVARFLGITNVQCNHFELDGDGRLTGGIVRPIVWGTTKAAAVRQFCADRVVAVQQSYFYADGDEDAASMALVGFPRPVNPRAGLAAAAAAHGWPVMCLASGRHGPVRRVRSLARHVRSEERGV
ncbi:haloacid dehalogenase [Mycobacterium saskatchewanense]|uniref:Haloacid dehalogenase n=1 Tax=Mycobacterium saskatchewanense TaxID=220927 RepID=A0AAJ3NNW9_9MYCO|nr:HAD-IB family hydrolase [Mycobacterium saskatchewanense]ORW68973.1 haloacid dehalogenase [Mycobacterium saskatchewanense]BBX61614.1 haloacid dehalogenase [Mycobacterium saskatchewanense]